MRTVTVKPLLPKHVSQIGSGATRYGLDCGPACLSMELYGYNGKSLTVDQLYVECTKGTIDKCVTFQQIEAVAGQYLVPMSQSIHNTEQDLYKVLREKRPPIALVNYGTIQKYTSVFDKEYKGAHFVVPVGITYENVLYLDPLYLDEMTQPIEIPVSGWMDAWNKASLDGNTPCSMLTPMLSVGVLQPVQKPTQKLYSIIVTCTLGLNIRSAPKVTAGNVIGGLPQGSKRDVYAEKKINSGEMWLAISPEKNAWIAGIYNGMTNYA